MRLSTWDPFTEMEAVLNRYRPQETKASTQTMTKADWHPVVDVSESEQSYHLHAELAGVDKDQISISVHENVLTLSGQRHSQHEESKGKVHRVERAYGSFVRNFTLPDKADTENIAARYQDGVLEIEIPKVEQEQPKRIDISIN
ncbi:Hsp20/alpha crystallin family protein [Pseudomonas sp. HK3]